MSHIFPTRSVYMNCNCWSGKDYGPPCISTSSYIRVKFRIFTCRRNNMKTLILPLKKLISLWQTNQTINWPTNQPTGRREGSYGSQRLQLLTTSYTFIPVYDLHMYGPSCIYKQPNLIKFSSTTIEVWKRFKSKLASNIYKSLK